MLVTRADMAMILTWDCWIRQNMINPLTATDVSSQLAPYVQAVTSSGGPMRDTFMQFGPVMSPGQFVPSGNVPRTDLATWLVRALGKDADAQAAMHTATSFTDDSNIPAAARGYVVVASSIGLMPGFVNPSPIEGGPVTYSWQPSTLVTRGALALTMDKWYDIFMTP